MSQQNLIIYQFTSFYKIFKEIEKELNFNIIEAIDEKSLKVIIRDLKDFNHKFLITDSFKSYSKQEIVLKIKKYQNILNSIWKNSENRGVAILLPRDSDYICLIEVNTIIYLSKAQNPISPMELQKNVWGYQSNLETHTVETHIYRLRKKFLDIFDDDSFILSINNGYKIK